MNSVSSLQHNTELDFNNYKITKLYLSDNVFPDLQSYKLYNSVSMVDIIWWVDIWGYIFRLKVL